MKQQASSSSASEKAPLLPASAAAVSAAGAASAAASASGTAAPSSGSASQQQKQSPAKQQAYTAPEVLAHCLASHRIKHATSLRVGTYMTAGRHRHQRHLHGHLKYCERSIDTCRL